MQFYKQMKIFKSNHEPVIMIQPIFTFKSQKLVNYNKAAVIKNQTAKMNKKIDRCFFFLLFGQILPNKLVLIYISYVFQWEPCVCLVLQAWPDSMQRGLGPCKGNSSWKSSLLYMEKPQLRGKSFQIVFSSWILLENYFTL